MAKLFAMEDFLNEEYKELEQEEIKEEINFENEENSLREDLKLVTENLQFHMNNIENCEKFKTFISSNPDISLEKYYFIIENISKNLGVKNIPSLEQFENKRTKKIALESIFEKVKSFIIYIWEKVKNFFIALWKRIKNFFAKLLGFNLELDAYEKEVERLMIKIKDSAYTFKDPSPIESKLGQILGDSSSTNFSEKELVINGFRKIENFTRSIKESNYSSLTTKITEDFSNLLDKIFIPYLEKLNIILAKGSEAIKSLNEVIKKAGDIEKGEAEEIENKLEEISANILSKKNDIFTAAKEMKDIIQEHIKISKDVIMNNINLIATSSGLEPFSGNLKNLPIDIVDKILDTVDLNRVNAMYKNKDDLKMPYDLLMFLFVYLDEEIYNVDDNITINEIKDIKIHTVFNKTLNTQISTKISPLTDKNDLQNLFNIYKNLSKIQISNFSKNCENSIDKIIKNMKAKEPTIERIDKHLKTLNSNLEDYPVFINYLTNFFNSVFEHNNENKELARRELEELTQTLRIISIYTKLFDSSIKVLLTLQQEYISLLREISVNIVSAYVELRFEIIKYIYENAKRFKKV